MTDERLKNLLQSAVAPAAGERPERDLWPALAHRFERTPRWSYLDLGLAAAAAVVLAMFPEWLWLLSYHL
jgi:hypothetical protein